TNTAAQQNTSVESETHPERFALTLLPCYNRVSGFIVYGEKSENVQLLRSWLPQAVGMMGNPQDCRKAGDLGTAVALARAKLAQAFP
ncbi:MAG: hypothetical protein ACK2US_16875, partial [Anaerolineae bacterium]